MFGGSIHEVRIDFFSNRFFPSRGGIFLWPNFFRDQTFFYQTFFMTKLFSTKLFTTKLFTWPNFFNFDSIKLILSNFFERGLSVSTSQTILQSIHWLDSQVYFFNTMIFVNGQCSRRNEPDNKWIRWGKGFFEFQVDSEPSLSRCFCFEMMRPDKMTLEFVKR